MVVWFARCIWQNARPAFLAAIIYLSLIIVYGIGTYAVLDPFIAFWLAAGMCCFWQAMQAQTEQKKSMVFTAGNSLWSGRNDQRFSCPCCSCPECTAFGCNAKTLERILHLWLAVVSCILTVAPWGGNRCPRA